jgi:uncharacterized protein YggU (UPF0235/DUF167 family)
MSISDFFKFNYKETKYIKIKVIPLQNKLEFVWIMDDETYKIRLTSTPEKWKANKELISFLSHELKIKKDCIKIISWEFDRIKIIRIN